MNNNNIIIGNNLYYNKEYIEEEKYTKENQDPVINPWYITGISDGEGSFQITIQDMKGLGKTGYKPFLEFKITQKKSSGSILYGFKKYFNCGRVNIDNRKTDTLKYVVTRNEDLFNKIIPHFDRYILKTSKYLDYINFRTAVFIMRDKKHLTKEGISLLRDIKEKMNKARSFEDRFNYCWNNKIKLEPEWVQGFVDGEGSFQCEIYKSKRNNALIQINFSLQVKQNNHDVAILYAIKDFFNSGYLKPKYNMKNIEEILKLSRTTTTYWTRDYINVINFFNKYPLFTKKRLDLLDWKRLILLKINKTYLDEKGLNLMINIKNNMNNGRII
jgi:LAGLIDADG endonuclease